MREHKKKKSKPDKKRRPRRTLAATEMKLILETIKTGKKPKRKVRPKVKKILQIVNR